FLFFIIVTRLLSDLRGALARERELARTDPLTALANTRAFTEMAIREIARARRTGRPLALACVDLNGFKKINDELGHAAGDEMLVMVGTALRSSTRKSDLPARLGGDEFAILLPETDEESVRTILDKVVDKVESYAVVEGRHASVSAGAVVSVSPPGLDELLRAADRLMYDVKRSAEARSRIEILGPGPE
ncbi:MAG: GGDEF domain-containing protein, partial [Thermoanaerobaculia bacterium]|nr:GGDEF domain-containing protein [Thermoanaerobaculia bacterium]